ncbi:benzoate 4-monooxygenase cytochrome P450 [Coniochaeta sp. 2T2.1]|nr:benzoate 4-monooxygenase cytochrome P450 [Coniochaeta sp. 2T2.1]
MASKLRVLHLVSWLRDTVFYCLAFAIYRLYLGPLRKFPGPKLAAANFLVNKYILHRSRLEPRNTNTHRTLSYEFYYDAVLGGQYTFHIAELQKHYGPVIRTNPHEMHVRTPEFYHVLYSRPGRRRHKWHWAMRGFGSDKATFAAVAHEVHHMRKTALNHFFSMAQVRQRQKLGPVIQEVIDAFMRRIDDFKDDGQMLRIDTACSAFTAVVIMEYAIGKPSRIVHVPEFDFAFHLF